MSDQVFVYTMNQGGNRGRWSRYVFPWVIEHFVMLQDNLYLRHADIVSKVVEGALDDAGVNFTSIVQWPWLDFGKPGVSKMMVGFDIVGVGAPSIEVGYDQSTLAAFTTPFAIPEDSAPGQIIPLPVTAPSFSIKLTYTSDTDWEWSALQIYVQDHAVGK